MDAVLVLDHRHSGCGVRAGTGRRPVLHPLRRRARRGESVTSRLGDDVTTVPGIAGYSSIRVVYEVQLARGIDAAEVRSHEQIEALALAGRAHVVATGRMLNLPIVPPASTLERDPAGRPLKAAWFK